MNNIYLKKIISVSVLFFLIGCKEESKESSPVKEKKCPFNPPQKEIPQIDCEKDIDFCIRNCESNTPLASHYCYQVKDFVKNNETELRRILRIGCDKGSSPLCIYLSDTYVYDHSNPNLPYKNLRNVPLENYKEHEKIQKDILPIVAARCETEKDATSCYVLSDYYSNNWPPSFIQDDLQKGPFIDARKKDLQLVLKYQTMACEYGYRAECADLASTYLRQSNLDYPVAYDKDKAKMYYYCDCENRDPKTHKECTTFEEDMGLK